jgi:DNA/RNA endonuclease YhcR with UshA esterase domain
MSKPMKWLTVLAAFGYLLSAGAQDTGTTNSAPLRVSALEAKKHMNTEAIVTGKVAEVNVAERLVRLNFERPYPSNTFTAVIFANKTNLFPNVRELKDKTVEVSGKIAEYRGHPEIILTSTNQLKVIEKDQGESRKEKP